MEYRRFSAICSKAVNEKTAFGNIFRYKRLQAFNSEHFNTNNFAHIFDFDFARYCSTRRFASRALAEKLKARIQSAFLALRYQGTGIQCDQAKNS